MTFIPNAPAVKQQLLTAQFTSGSPLSGGERVSLTETSKVVSENQPGNIDGIANDCGSLTHLSGQVTSYPMSSVIIRKGVTAILSSYTDTQATVTILDQEYGIRLTLALPSRPSCVPGYQSNHCAVIVADKVALIYLGVSSSICYFAKITIPENGPISSSNTSATWIKTSNSITTPNLTSISSAGDGYFLLASGYPGSPNHGGYIWLLDESGSVLTSVTVAGGNFYNGLSITCHKNWPGIGLVCFARNSTPSVTHVKRITYVGGTSPTISQGEDILVTSSGYSYGYTTSFFGPNLVMLSGFLCSFSGQSVTYLGSTLYNLPANYNSESSAVIPANSTYSYSGTAPYSFFGSAQLYNPNSFDQNFSSFYDATDEKIYMAADGFYAGATLSYGAAYGSIGAFCTHAKNKMCLGLPARAGWKPFPANAVKLTETLYAGACIRRDHTYISAFVGSVNSYNDVISGSAASTLMGEYAVSRYDDSTLAILFTETGTALKLRAFTCTDSGTTAGTTVDIATVTDRRYIDICDNMFFYENGADTFVNTYSCSGNAATIGTPSTMLTADIVYPGRFASKIIKYSATDNLFLYVANSGTLPKCVKTNGTTHSSYNVSAIPVSKITGAKMSDGVFVIGTSRNTSSSSMNLYISDGTQNTYSLPAISPAYLQAIIRISDTRVLVCYNTSAPLNQSYIGASGSWRGRIIGHLTNGDTSPFSGINFLQHASDAKTYTSYGMITCCYPSSTNSGSIQSYFNANTKVGNMASYSSLSGSGTLPTQFCALASLPDTSTTLAGRGTTRFQYYNIVAGELVADDGFDAYQIQIMDGGMKNEYTLWLRDVHGNYIEGGFEDIRRALIGIAKSDVAYNSTASIALYGARIDGGYGNLEAGQQLLDAAGDEIGYAVSASEVLMLEE